LFCRYRITAGDDELNEVGQCAFFKDNQGQPVPYRRWGAKENEDSSIQIMEPKFKKVDDTKLISTLIGLKPGVRTVVNYDRTSESRTRTSVADTHIKTAHLVLVPEYNILAIQDKSNDFCFPARAAIRIFRSVVRGFLGDDSELDIAHLNDTEVKRAIESWALTDYQYTVRPLNPITLSDLTNERSELMKAENIARDSSHLHAPPGESMKPNGGPISQTQEMVDAGYGQNGFKGITPDGHLGHIPKPTFHMEKEKNLSERDKPRFVRIIFESDDEDIGEHALANEIARALMNFYVR
jgi:hypothetical protein